jgi:hypothetical protein
MFLAMPQDLRAHLWAAESILLLRGLERIEQKPSALLLVTEARAVATGCRHSTHGLQILVIAKRFCKLNVASGRYPDPSGFCINAAWCPLWSLRKC